MGRITLLVLGVSCAAWATEEVVLTADTDSYVYHYEIWEEDPQYEDDNFGADPLMYVLSNYYQWGEECEIAFLHFDFSGLDEYDTPDMIAAQLLLHAESDASGAQLVHVVTCPWEEMTITFNNQPTRGRSLATFEMHAGYNYVDLDIIPIAPWVDVPETAYGIVINDGQQVMEYDPVGIIHTRETDYAPQLRLFFTDVTVEESSWGNIKASF
jgi:hypothetical protein